MKKLLKKTTYKQKFRIQNLYNFLIKNKLCACFYFTQVQGLSFSSLNLYHAKRNSSTSNQTPFNSSWPSSLPKTSSSLEPSPMAPRYSLLYFLQNAKRRTRGINHSGKLPWGSISHHFNHRRGELYNSDQPLCIVVIHPVMSLEKDDIINLQQKLLETA